MSICLLSLLWDDKKILGTCPASPKPMIVSATASAAISLTPVDFSDRTLANGLRVLLVEDHRTPTVAINVGYRVGGKDDPPGRSGFAHLFEHLMIKAAANRASETIDEITKPLR